MMELPQDSEIWRAVDGYMNYQVSSHGRVRNAKTGRILKQYINKKGYAVLSLCKPGHKTTTIRVHRLVCIAFNENPSNKPGIDHIDRNRQNNHYSNLRWATHMENNRNKTIASNNRSGIIGVAQYNENGLWTAFINNNDSKIVKKAFQDKDDAIAWRKQKEMEFGYSTQ